MVRPTREMKARALALEAGEFFDNLAEGTTALKPAEDIAAADYANQVAEQMRKWASAMEAEAQAKREERRAQQWHTLPDGTLQRLKGTPA